MPIGWILTEEQKEQIVSEYMQGDSSIILARRYDITYKAVLGLLERRGIQRRPRKTRTIPLDESVFDIVTEDSAYWAGFLMADGCISRTDKTRSPAILVVLSAQDSAHLKSFRAFLKSQHAIKTYSRTDSFSTKPKVKYQVRSLHLVEALAQFGVTDNKSDNGRVFFLENNRHFWRGYIDGDGCWTSVNNKLRLSICGTDALLAQFQSFMHSISPNITSSISHQANISILNCMHAASITIANYIYRDCSIYLPRKEYIVSNYLTQF